MRIDSLFYRLAYRSGTPRWDSTEPRPELVKGRAPGRALDIGCGTGSDVLYLASLGWDATGVDFGRIGRAGTFVFYHLVRKRPGAADAAGDITAAPISTGPGSERPAQRLRAPCGARAPGPAQPNRDDAQLSGIGSRRPARDLRSHIACRLPLVLMPGVTQARFMQ